MKCNLLTNLFVCSLLDAEEESDTAGELRIPLMVFRDRALPICTLAYHDMEIQIEDLPGPSSKFQYTLEWEAIISPSEDHRVLCQNGLQYYMLQTQDQMDDKEFIQLNFNHVVNFILVRIIPTKADSICDYISLQPYLESAEFLADGLQPPVIFTAEQMIEYEFMGIKLYAIPLSPKVLNRRILADYIQNNKLDMVGVNFSRFDDILLRLNVDGGAGGNYTYMVTAVNVNVGRHLGGMGGVAFS